VRVLLIGSGAREHALAWKLRQSPRVDELMCLPGNPGMTRLGSTIEGVSPTDAGAVAAVARVHAVDLVVVGPEAPLAAGVSDAVTRLGIPVWGPSRAAARLETSKAFAKDVLTRAGAPTPQAWTFTEAAEAHRHVADSPGPYVVKADGLAGGKGVLVTDDRSAAHDWVDGCFGGRFGDAGSTVVIETHAAGAELSVFAVCDGERATTLEPARDYKRLGDGDTGPNTGGMGSYSPVDLPSGLVDDVRERIIEPVLATMASDGHPYIGFLYAGLILTADGPQVIEFNARLGDPETQVVLPRLESDLIDVIESALDGRAPSNLTWAGRAAVNVVLAADGYPEAPRSGDVVTGAGLDDPDVLVFHAGTSHDDRGRLVTAGGRVLSVVGLGEDVETARSAAYAGVERIGFSGKRFRRDIAG
jgi:phosphoribosylamine--glycine ligase